MHRLPSLQRKRLTQHHDRFMQDLTSQMVHKVPLENEQNRRVALLSEIRSTATNDTSINIKKKWIKSKVIGYLIKNLFHQDRGAPPVKMENQILIAIDYSQGCVQ